MNLSGRLEDAFSSNDAIFAALVITGEKSSMSLVDRLDEVANRELHKNEFKNVTLILQAIEHLISKDTDCINRLVHHGIVMKMLNWFEKVSDYLKKQPKPTKSPVVLMEVFYEVSMSLCQCNVEGSSRILEILLLRFGAVVMDPEVTFSLRLEAIKTINTMLDNASKETRKKLCQPDDYSFLLEEFAKVVMNVGDYEMQVAITEALCRLTPKKLREEFACQWFNNTSFAAAFTAIRVKEFETDCRIFLNKLNSYFGASRSVFSFPCIRAFVNFNEFFKPEDDLLQQFWVDFNVGTSCISFYVNDPEGTLWELIHLPKETLSTYSLQESDDQKILQIHMSLPVIHGAISGKMVQIAFDSQHDIQTAVERVYVGVEKSLETSKHVASFGEDSGVFSTADNTQISTSSPVPVTEGRRQVSFVLQSGPGKLPSPKSKTAPEEDPFSLQISSDTEKKLRIFHSESDAYVLPSERRLSREAPHSDYTRKKPRRKSKLKVLPLSSPSSMEEEYFKESTPKRRLLERKDKDVVEHDGKETDLQTLELSHPHKESAVDSGFQDKIVSEDTIFSDEKHTVVTEKPDLGKVPPPTLRIKPQESTAESYVGPETTEEEEPSPFSTLKPRRLFSSTLLESTTETVTQALMEDEESETELGSGVTAAFETFKAQLREHFSSRYKKVEAKSLRSLTDCQKNVSTLLQTVHNQRLVHLDQFQDTVVQQLGQLERNCLSLKHIEQETVRFWQSESDRVKSFCDKQQMRVDSIEILKETRPVQQNHTESTKGMTSSSSGFHASLSMAIPDNSTSQPEPSIVPMTIATS